MQIKKLVMQGFGRYARTQEIDFENALEDRNIFVVTGKTGAGKTTIFDAINFALYGDASGSSRDGKSLRSDHADINTPTEVELWFSIRDKTYYIKRSPQYSRAKQRGDGVTESKAAAEMILPDGKVLTGYEGVTKKVEEILGITPMQFKQLVMIPQGEFKKLLEAPSDQKENIFRKIFGTEAFQWMQKKLNDQANALKQDIKEVQNVREKRIRAFECGEDNTLFTIIQAEDLNIQVIIESFEEAIQKDNQYYDEVEKQRKVFDKQIETLTNQLAVGKDGNKKLEDLIKVKEELKLLQAEEPEVTNKKEKLEKANKAAIVANLEEQYCKANSRCSQLEKDIEKLEHDTKDKEKAYIEAKDLYDKEQEKEDDRIQLNAQINAIDALSKKVGEYEQVVKVIQKGEGKKVQLEREIKETEEKIEAGKEVTIKIEKEIEEIRQSKQLKSQVQLEIKDLEKEAEGINQLEKGLEKRAEYEIKHQEKSATYEALNRKYMMAKNDYEDKENRYKRNQAGILAKDLVKGNPCPVCGSIEHPSPTRITEAEISEQAVEEAKQNYIEAQQLNEEALSDVKKYYDRIKQLEVQSIYPAAIKIFNVDAHEKIDGIKTRVLEAKTTVNENIGNLEKQIKVLDEIIRLEEAKKQQQENLKREQEINTSIKEQKYKELKDIELEIKGADSNKNVLIKEFDGEIRTKEELDRESNTLSEKLKSMRTALEKSNKQYETTKGEWQTSFATLATKKKDLELMTLERDEALKAFKKKVLSLGFENGNAYREAKLNEEEIALLTNDIKLYEDKVLTTNTNYVRLEKETKDLEQVNLEEIGQKIEECKKNRSTKETEGKKIYAKMQGNEKILSEAIAYTQKIADKEAKYSIIGSLAKQVNGDNPRKMSLERYVLAAYFEDIITAANLRLSDMTANQYELFRKEDVGDKRKEQGLDLEVLDNYTGKKRGVNTLSGGEGFKASLALALGLADVVQAHAGGIQLDTMFIDEGFGTLDSESLDAAIECLVDLQNDGRVVGIISHVEELKERIPTHLHVTSTQEGSTVEFKCC